MLRLCTNTLMPRMEPSRSTSCDGAMPVNHSCCSASPTVSRCMGSGSSSMLISSRSCAEHPMGSDTCGRKHRHAQRRV
jgi:hypothetical protein